MFAYYKRFITNFAHLVMPLVIAGEEDKKRDKSKTMGIQRLWGSNQERSFVALKAAMAEAPVLACPDFKLPFIVISDFRVYSYLKCLPKRQR